jgi:DNA invertase Pin-like site-specific DNA recombinase
MDTTSAHGRLLLNILGKHRRKFERELIRSRTSEGRARAKLRGGFGRKPKLTKHQVQEALARKNAGEALAEIGRSYNVSHSTISRLG